MVMGGLYIIHSVLFLSEKMMSKADRCNVADCDIHADKNYNGLCVE